jgi:hypothetical protein
MIVPERNVLAGTGIAKRDKGSAGVAGDGDRETFAMTYRWTVAVAGLVALPAMVVIGASTGAVAQGRRTDTITGSCVFAYGTASCVRQYRYNDAGNTGIKQYGEAAAEEAAAESRERERLWVSRCRPALREDALGVSRYVYAAPGCEYGRFRD